MSSFKNAAGAIDDIRLQATGKKNLEESTIADFLSIAGYETLGGGGGGGGLTKVADLAAYAPGITVEAGVETAISSWDFYDSPEAEEPISEIPDFDLAVVNGVLCSVYDGNGTPQTGLVVAGYVCEGPLGEGYDSKLSFTLYTRNVTSNTLSNLNINGASITLFKIN